MVKTRLIFKLNENYKLNYISLTELELKFEKNKFLDFKSELGNDFFNIKGFRNVDLRVEYQSSECIRK